MQIKMRRSDGATDFLAGNEGLYNIRETFEFFCVLGESVSGEHGVSFAEKLIRDEALDW